MPASNWINLLRARARTHLYSGEIPVDDVNGRELLEEIVAMKVNARPRRMWINQPSTAQPLHELHGARVLAVHEYDDTLCIYFLDGDTISMQCSRLCLSEGWPGRR